MIAYKYYIEIKNRFLLLTLSWSSVVLVSYNFKEVLLFLVTKKVTFTFYNKHFNAFFYFIFTDVTEIFSVYIVLVFFIVNQVLVYYFFYHLLTFVSLGLYKFELNHLSFVFKISIVFFLFSVIIYNKLLFPISWEFFLSFQEFAILDFFILHFEAKLVEYLYFYITFHYICILYFQVFMFLILFFVYVKNEYKTIKRFRKLVYFSFVVFSTLITPPDVLSQIVLSLSFVFSYELVVFYIITKSWIKK